MDSSAKNTITRSIKHALDGSITSSEYMQSYNAIYSHCTHKTKAFEILGRKVYDMLEKEIEMYTKSLVYTSIQDFVEIMELYEKGVEIILGMFKYVSRFYVKVNLDMRVSSVLPLKKMMYSKFYFNFVVNIENVLIASLNTNVLKFYYQLLVFSDHLEKFEYVKRAYTDSISFSGPPKDVISQLKKCLTEIDEVFIGKNSVEIIKSMRYKIANTEEIFDYFCECIENKEDVDVDVLTALNGFEKIYSRIIKNIFEDQEHTVDEQMKKYFGAIGMFDDKERNKTSEKCLELLYKFICCYKINEKYFNNDDFVKKVEKSFFKNIVDRNTMYETIMLFIDQVVRYKYDELKIVVSVLSIFSEDLHRLVHFNILKRVLLNLNDVNSEREFVKQLEEKIKYFGRSRLALFNFIQDVNNKNVINLVNNSIKPDLKTGDSMAYNSPNSLIVSGIYVRCFTKSFWPIKPTKDRLSPVLQKALDNITHQCRNDGFKIEFNHYYSKVKLEINKHVVVCNATMASLILNVSECGYDQKTKETSQLMDVLVKNRIVLRNGLNYEINEQLDEDINLFSPVFEIDMADKIRERIFYDKDSEILKCKIMKTMKRKKTMDINKLLSLDKNTGIVLDWLFKNNYLKQEDDCVKYVP